MRRAELILSIILILAGVRLLTNRRATAREPAVARPAVQRRGGAPALAPALVEPGVSDPRGHVVMAIRACGVVESRAADG
jgi:hypothetical protein